ncbi:MAG: antibiotic biosynthesis monooxygenase [archaeon]|nr:antibiotic biosynthesis monooxygenase [archaeon]
MIIVIAKVIPKEGKEPEFIKIASDLVDITRNEEKNISYDLVSSLDDNAFLFIEKWEDMDGLNQHLNSAHFKFFDHCSKVFTEDSEITVYDSEEIHLME